jgi:tetratricopeptide (TPR) repeat protein
MTAIPAPTNRRRLDSWKEIAVFFGRDERTVNRWEKDLGLPVHRLPGTRGRVYAYTDELSNWLATPRNAREASPDQATKPPDGGSTRPLAVVDEASSQGQFSSRAEQQSTNDGKPTRSGWVVGAVLVILVLATMLIWYSTSGRMLSGRKGDSAGATVALPHAVVQASSHAHNPEAEQLYLKGRYYWNKRTPDDLNKAVDYFVQAIVRDPNYAAAYVGLADCYNLLREFSAMPANEAYTRAYAAAKKAVELDDQSSAAHASLAFVLFYGKWDVAAAEGEFRRAIDLDPNNAIAHHWYATYLLTLRRLSEALAEIERAQSLDPSSTAILADKGDILFHVGSREEAINLLKQMEATEPSFRSPHLYLKHFYLALEDYPDFLTEAKEDALLMHDQVGLAITGTADKGFAAGGGNEMLENVLVVQKQYYARKKMSPFSLAETCALLGKTNESLAYLQTAYTQHDESVLSVQISPELNSLHGEPGYHDLLMKLHLPIQ